MIKAKISPSECCKLTGPAGSAQLYTAADPSIGLLRYDKAAMLPASAPLALTATCSAQRTPPIYLPMLSAHTSRWLAMAVDICTYNYAMADMLPASDSCFESLHSNMHTAGPDPLRQNPLSGVNPAYCEPVPSVASSWNPREDSFRSVITAGSCFESLQSNMHTAGPDPLRQNRTISSIVVESA